MAAATRTPLQEPARRMGVPDRAAAADLAGIVECFWISRGQVDFPVREDPAAEQRRADVQPANSRSACRTGRRRDRRFKRAWVAGMQREWLMVTPQYDPSRALVSVERAHAAARRLSRARHAARLRSRRTSSSSTTCSVTQVARRASAAGRLRRRRRCSSRCCATSFAAASRTAACSCAPTRRSPSTC